MTNGNVTGAILSVGTTVLGLITVAMTKQLSTGFAEVAGTLLLPGYVEYACVREALIGKINIHQDVGEWLLGGFALNMATWILITHAAIWTLDAFKKNS